MVLKSPDHQLHFSASPPPKPQPNPAAFLLSISYLMSLCAKHATRFSAKLKPNTKPKPSGRQNDIKSPKYSSFTRPKRLLTQISNKAIALMPSTKKRIGQDKDDVLGPGDFGDGGVWQKDILMGDKCQPLAFSGVIYYDSNGKQLNELPLRSPRASPLPGYLIRGKEYYVTSR